MLLGRKMRRWCGIALFIAVLVYTRERMIKSENLANETEKRTMAKMAMKKIIAYITALQMPKNCSTGANSCSAQEAVMRLGFGHTMYRVTRCFGEALSKQRTFVWEGEWLEYASTPVDEVMRPTSSCVSIHQNSEKEKDEESSLSGMPLSKRCSPSQRLGCAGSPGVTVPAAISPQLLEVLHVAGLNEYDWDSALLRWLVRGSPLAEKYFHEQKAKVNFPERVKREDGAESNGVVSLHIRAGGDKFTNTPLAKFVNMIIELCQKTKVASSKPPVPHAVYIASDNPVVVETIRTSLHKHPEGKNLRIIALGDDSISRTGKSISHAFSLFPPKEKRRRARLAIMEVMTDVLLLAEADYLIGSCGSWISTIAARVQNARLLEQRGSVWHKPLMPELPLCNGVESEIISHYSSKWEF